MNLLISIFGGMLLTAVLYGIGRMGRLSNFWASVMAALLPTLAYLVYATMRWPGLDVVTLHVVAYPTVSVLLSQLYGSKADHAKSLHWAPKLMIGFFMVLSLVYGGLVYVAGNGLPPALARVLLPNVEGKNIHTGFAGVVGHHQEAAKVIGHHQKMESRLESLGWGVEVNGLAAVRAGSPIPVSVTLTDRDGNGVGGVEVSLELVRPGHTSSNPQPLAEVNPGLYQAQLTPVEAGSWVALLALRQGEESIVLERTLTAP